MRILTTGVLSGLGKYIHEELGGIGFTRNCSSEDLEKLKILGVDVIIHCAFNSSNKINNDSLYNYLEDNVFLTKELVNIPHMKFIFISSVDVYPKNKNFNSEDDIIEIDSISGIYAITKLMSESIVKKYCKNYLILRGSTLLGKYSRENSLIKIMKNKKCDLSLSEDSMFNYVLHEDIVDFIKYSLKYDLTGVYNLSSSEKISLLEVADIFNKNVKFGAHQYDVGNINNTKISSIFPVFKKTSKDFLIDFIRSNEHE